MASLFDELLGSPDEDEKALDFLNKATGAYDGIEPLDLGPVEYEDAQYLGDYKPSQFAQSTGVSAPEMYGVERAMANQIDGTAFDDLQSDPRLRDAQMGALSQLQDVAEGGGLTASDRAQLSKVNSDVAAADRGRRDAILQNMDARGMGGSSNELLAQLQSAQAATDEQSQRSMDVSALAQQRALDAIAQQGQMAGQIRGQDFGEGSARAQAKDAINQFNSRLTADNSQFNAGQGNQALDSYSGRALQADMFTAGATNDASKFNAGMANDAGMAGWNAKQNVANQNSAGRNQNNVRNALEIPQANFNSRMNVAQGKSNAAGQGVNFWGQKGNQKAATKAGLAQGAMQVGAGAMMMSDEKKKHSVSNFELDDFLGALKPKSFRYKNPKEKGALPGNRVGFIAQDVDDTELGKEFISENEEGTLQYDSQNLQGIQLAALKQINERLKKLEGRG